MKDCIVREYGCSCTTHCKADIPLPAPHSRIPEYIALAFMVLSVFGAGYLALERVERAYAMEARI